MGDIVRIVVYKFVFFKVYRGIFTEEVFRIVFRYRKFFDYYINLYRLKDLMDDDIRGVYYEGELEKV